MNPWLAFTLGILVGLVLAYCVALGASIAMREEAAQKSWDERVIDELASKRLRGGRP